MTVEEVENVRHEIRGLKDAIINLKNNFDREVTILEKDSAKMI